MHVAAKLRGTVMRGVRRLLSTGNLAAESMDKHANDRWPFDQAPNVAALTTRQVLERNFPILIVTHYADDDSWAFVCGTTED